MLSDGGKTRREVLQALQALPENKFGPYGNKFWTKRNLVGALGRSRHTRQRRNFSINSVMSVGTFPPLCNCQCETVLIWDIMLQFDVCLPLSRESTRFPIRFGVFQHEFANSRLSCEGAEELNSDWKLANSDLTCDHAIQVRIRNESAG